MAPNFRPFEKKDVQKKHLHSPDWKKAMDSRTRGATMKILPTPRPLSEKRTCRHNPRFITAKSSRSPPGMDIIFNTFRGIYSVSKMQFSCWRVAWALPVCRPDNVYQEHRRTPVLNLTKIGFDRVLVHRILSVQEPKLIFSSYILLQHMKRRHEQAAERVNWFLDLEMSSFSLSTQYLSNYRAKFLALYKGKREKYENSASN